MKSITNSKIIILITLSILFTSFPIISTNLSVIIGNSSKNLEYRDDGNFENKNLKISAVSEKIHINNNWTVAKATGICTGNGSYSEPYVIEDLVIDGKGLGSAILIENSVMYFRIENCTLYNSGSYTGDAGISLYNVSYGLLISNNCSSNYYGIYLELSDNNTISGNNANNNIYGGIDFWDSDNNTLSENNVNNNYIGIDLWYSDNNILSGNTIHNSSYIGIQLMASTNSVLLGNVMNLMGIQIGGSQEDMATQTIDKTNLANDKPIYYYADKVGLRPSNFTNAGQIILVNCNDSIISGVSLTFVYAGITFWYCDNNTISENTINNNYIGINLGWSNNTKISGNTVNNNDYGIGLGYSKNNVLSGNTVNKNMLGIYLGLSDNNTISGNLIRDNTQHGILILTLLGIQSTQNLFFKNTFLNNTVHAIDDGINNYWNNSIIGNYWDNYTGIDANSDEIGDTPHTFNSGTDYLPIVDTTAPTIIVKTPEALDLFGRNAPDFNVEITDILLDTMWYTVDNSVTNITFTSNGTLDQALWDILPEGNVVIKFFANDTSGRMEFAEVTIRKDVTAPTININSPIPNELCGASAPSFNVEIYDTNLDSMWYSLDNGLTNTTFTTNGTIYQSTWDTLLDGTVSIIFYANDSAGNIGVVEVTIGKDVNTPVITINNPHNSDIIGAIAPNFDISIDELNLNKTWYSLNGGNIITFTGLTGTINQALWDALPEGNVIIRFYANDTLGRIGFQEVTVVKEISQSNPPGIPGYNILLLFGIVSTIAVIIIKKRLNHF